MAAEVDALDDDQWLYGDGAGEDNAFDLNGKGGLDTDEKIEDSLLDQIDDVNGLGSSDPEPVSTEINIKSTSESKDKSPTDEEESSAVKQETAGGGGEEEEEEEEGDEGSDSDDDVKITIGEIKNPGPAGYNRAGYGRLPSLSGTGGDGLVNTKKVDLDAVPQLNGVPLPDVDLESIDKPWQKPGADITDYFNYGFTEETWKLYCDKQRKMRYEATQLNKVVVPSLPMAPNMFLPPPILEPPKPPLDMGLPPALPPDFANVMSQASQDSSKDNEGDGGETKNEATPPPETSSSNSLLPHAGIPLKPPILPPPGLHPPHLPILPHHSQQDMAAAMAAAMFGGAPPPPMRPDFPPGFPPPLPGTVPPFPPPVPGMPPPFGFHGDHPRGPPPMDERGPLLPHDGMGFPPGFSWDPSLGPPPPEFLMESYGGYPGRVAGSRSPSRSSSSGRSSDRDDSKSRHRGDRRERAKERSRDHRHHGRSRSRSRDRHRHYRDRDRDRDRGRSERHEKERREHRRREERRHEKSRKHRSGSPEDTSHRSHKKRSSKSRSPS